MTIAIYVTSTQSFSGKSALCVGLLRRLKKHGYAVGYMKPVSTQGHLSGDRLIDEDVQFMRATFALDEPVEAMAPVILTDRKVAQILAGDEEEATERVRSAYEAIAAHKDVVVLEGGGSLREGWFINLAPPHVADLLGARELVIVPYMSDMQLADDLVTARVRLGDSLLGAVINSVPAHRMDFVRTTVRRFVEGRGVPVFGVLPKERVLLSVSVAELNEGLGGEILTAHRAAGELVEHLAVGAMNVDSALKYFRQRPHQAVITGGDRADIQVAALQSSTRCLILTGNLRPTPQIIGRAEEQGVPIILTRHDTMTAIERIEKFFGKTRFHQEEKIVRFETLLEQHMDFEALYKLAGLAKGAQVRAPGP